MRWEDFRQSENIDDRRGDTEYASAGGGGGMGLPFPIPGAGGGGGGLGIGMVIVLGILGMLFGVDPRILIGGGQILSGGRAPQQQVQPQQTSRRQSGPPTDEVGKFISAVVAMNEDVWKEVLPQQKNIQYTPPTLVIFNRVTNSGCGTAQSAMGPFYCPLDRKVYLDTSFFNDMKRRTCWASPARCTSGASAWASARATRCRCAWNCRPTASPGSGRAPRRR